jgi:Ca2+-binding RTX toxin-like protein
VYSPFPVYSPPSGEEIVGTAEADTLTGGNGPDFLQGGEGNDILRGGLGNDTYHYESGDGQDDVYDTGGYDVISFGPGITPDDVTAGRVVDAGYAAGFFLRLGDGGHIHIRGTFSAIEEVRFDDGTVWDAYDLAVFAATNQTVFGTSFNDYLTGTPGVDYLHGLEGNDTLFGGRGDDALIGGEGNDTYYFNLGDGRDQIIDSDGTLDVIRFGWGIAPEDVLASSTDAGIVLSIGGNGDEIAVNDGAIEEVHFAGGGVWTIAYLLI